MEPMQANFENGTGVSGWAPRLPTIRWLPAKFIWLNALALIAMALGLTLASLLPQGPSYHKINPGAILIFFDGRWYQDIALHGYQWDGLRSHQQNVAFFPLYPLIERLFILLLDIGSQYGLALLSLLFGLWSNIAFSGLALRLLPERSAFLASAFFICWPAACFLWMGYPTGLINLCTIYCLKNYIEGRHFRAAIWCGIGSATAPTMVFIAIAICIHMAFKWITNSARPHEIPKLIAFGLLSVSGLLAFMAYMFLKFHDAFVFIKVQDAWATTPSLATHMIWFLNPIRYLFVFGFVRNAANGILFHNFLATETGRNYVNISLQFLIDFMCVFFGMVFSFRKLNFLKPISLASIFVILGYLWFVVSTSFYFSSGIRLCYPALALFLGLGDWAAKSKAKSYVLLAVFVVFLICETALVKAGYAVI